MTPHLKPGMQEDIQNYYLQCVTDFERSGDHVYGICERAEAMNERNKRLSQKASDELNLICEPLKALLNHTSLAFTKQNLDEARKVEALVVTINEMAKKCRDNHMERMRIGVCDAVTGSFYLDVMMHIGRVADMCSNIAIHTLMRHNSKVENYEHIYMAALHRGDNEDYNRELAKLTDQFLAPL